jgi:hypothetical protein
MRYPFKKGFQAMQVGRNSRRSVGFVVSWLGAGLIAAGFLVRIGLAAPTAEQIEKLHAAEAAVTKAETLYKANKAKDAAAALAEAAKDLEPLAAAKEMPRQVEPIRKRIVNLHDNMEIDGAKVGAVPASLAAAIEAPMPEKPVAKPAPIKTAPQNPIANRPIRPGKTPAGGAGAGTVSFTRQVAPMLVAKCGKCHVSAAKGQVSMATYASLMRGSAKDGTIVLPGKGEGSRIVEVIVSGDMPRGGGMVAPDELKLLQKWIDEGAKFDGRDPSDNLTNLSAVVPAAKPEEPAPMLAVVAATGKEGVLFSRDIAPVLSESCTECHGGGQNVGGQRKLTTFKNLLIGGDSGLAFQPGNPATSVLLKKLKGTAGERMPKGKPPLADAVIAKFEQWIKEGGKYDGGDPNQDVEQLAGVYIASVSTHEQLATARADRARKMWHLGNPDAKSVEKDSKNFFLIGNVNEEKLAEVATAAEQAATSIGRSFHVPEDKPLVKGKMTLFVFRKKFDYGEFGRMVETREISPGSRGHFRYTVINAYGTVIPPDNNEYSLLGLVGEEAGGLYVASLGHAPRWFSEGAGGAIGLTIDNKDPRLHAYLDLVPEALGMATRPDAFISNGMPQDENIACSIGFVSTLMKQTTKFHGLLNAIQRGQDFDAAFMQAFRATASQAATMWAAKK